jgi:hypothetical protein
MASDLCVGFGVVDITPTPPAEQPDAFTVFDPISFRAMVIRRGDEVTALLSGDFFSFEQNLIDIVRDELSDIDVLPPANIITSVSHIGGSPILFPSYVHQPCEHLRQFGQEQKFAKAAADAIRLAVGDLCPARIGFNVLPCPGVAYNRRSHDDDGKLIMSNAMLPYPRPELHYGAVDDNVYVLRVDEPSDDYLPQPRGALVVFGCHALANSDKLGHISADYPSYLRRVIENAWPGATAMFMPGALGNVVPFHRGGRTYQCVGNAVGGVALAALERAATHDDQAVRIEHRTIAVPTFTRVPLAEAEAELAAITNGTDGTARMNVYAARRHVAAKTSDYTMTALHVGDAVLLYLPGEVFVETADAIRAVSRGKPTIIMSGPAADVGYLCPPQAHAEGGMEPMYTAVAGEAEALVRAAACELVAGVTV